MMKNNLLVNLPEDVLITNILLSKVLPIKSLLSLRCVCKYLRNLINSPAFIKMQLHHSTINNNNNNPLVLIKATYRPDVFFSLKFNVGGGDPCRPDEVVEFVSPIECSNIWGSCNGLVCLGGKGDTVCLWNPFTKEYRVLPPPLPSSFILNIPIGGNVSTRSSITYGFGYDRILDDYKIIRCSQHFVVLYDDYSYHIPFMEFQVYALGTNTWRKISNDNNPYKSYFVLSELMANKPIVLVNGALHWIMTASDWWKNSSEKTEPKIVSLDIEKQVFQEIQTPSMAKFKLNLSLCVRIEVLRGCLCVLENDSSNETLCHVWMMMDYGVKESWTKLFTIVGTKVPDDSPMWAIWPGSYRMIRFCENGTEILMGSYNVIVVYDMINNTARRVEFGENFGKCMYQTEIYIESLVSLNSRVYKGERRIRSKRKNRSKKQKRVSKLVRDFGNINLD